MVDNINTANVESGTDETLNRIGYIASLMWQSYLKNGGDPNVFKNRANIPTEKWDEYLESKRV